LSLLRVDLVQFIIAHKLVSGPSYMYITCTHLNAIFCHWVNTKNDEGVYVYFHKRDTKGLNVWWTRGPRSKRFQI